MISVGIDSFVSGFLVAGLVFFVVIWLYYDRRDRLYYDRQRLRNVHHCVKCGKIYTSTATEGDRVAECPFCGFNNASLRF